MRMSYKSDVYVTKRYEVTVYADCKSDADFKLEQLKQCSNHEYEKEMDRWNMNFEMIEEYCDAEKAQEDEEIDYKYHNTLFNVI